MTRYVDVFSKMELAGLYQAWEDGLDGSYEGTRFTISRSANSDTPGRFVISAKSMAAVEAVSAVSNDTLEASEIEFIIRSD